MDCLPIPKITEENEEAVIAVLDVASNSLISKDPPPHPQGP